MINQYLYAIAIFFRCVMRDGMKEQQDTVAAARKSDRQDFTIDYQYSSVVIVGLVVPLIDSTRLTRCQSRFTTNETRPSARAPSTHPRNVNSWYLLWRLTERYFVTATKKNYR